jgi:hypothetical protein
MRYWVLLLVTLFCVGCGNADPPSKADPPHLIAGSFIVPSITSLAPANVPVDSAPFTLTVNGSDFGTDTIVFWNGLPLNTRYVSSMQVIAQLQPVNLQFAGLVPVYVRTQGYNSNTVDFDVTIE